MKYLSRKHISLSLASLVTVSAMTLAPVAAARGDGSGSSGSNTGDTATSTTNPTPKPVSTEVHKSGETLSSADKTRLTNIKQRGDNEVNRRVNSLNGLIKKVQAASYVSDTDKAALIAELNAALSGLQTTKSTVDNDSDVTSAKSDAQTIISDYHVYAFIVPKVQLVLTADRQQVIEGKLIDVATKLQTSIDASKTAGKDTTALQAKHDDLVTQVKAAQAISSDVESKLLPLQTSGDFNTDHSLLKGYRDQLKTARKDIGTAVSDAHTIVDGLKKL